MDELSRVFSKGNILLVTHSFATGPPQELRDYLKGRAGKLLYIEHPFSYCDDRRSSVALYHRGIEKKKKYFGQMKGPDILFYFKDFFLSIYCVLAAKTRFDVAIAADNLNALSALFLKRLGRVKKIIFFTIDYTPVRFQNKILNYLYHWIDRICCYNADLIWNDSDFMMIARKDNGVDPKRCAPHIVVPSGNHFSKIKRLPAEQVDRNALVYMGHISARHGIDLVVESLPDLLKINPEIKFIVVGKGEHERSLRGMARQLGVENRINFKGYVEDNEDMENILAKCAIGIATYLPDPANVSNFSDTGKTKVYMACGLPVIITNASSMSRQIEDRKAGAAIDYDKNQFIKAVVELSKNAATYSRYRQNAIAFAREFDWDVLFKNALDETFKVIL